MNYQEYQKARDAAKLATKIDQAIALFELNTGFVYPTDWRLHVNTLKKSLQDLSRAEREQLLQDLEEEFNRWI